MRFCMVTTFFPPQHFGGDAIAVSNLANLLTAAGHEVEVIHCADSFELLKGQVAPSGTNLHPSVKVHCLRSPWGPLSPVLTQLTGHPGVKSAALERLLQRDFDVIHWHNLSLVAGPAAVKTRKAVQLCTLHDYWWLCPTSLLFKYTGEACNHQQCFRCTLMRRRPPQLWRKSDLLPEAASKIDRFLAPSEFVRRRYLQSELGIQPTVLPHPSIPTPYQPQRRKDSYYLYVGRLSEEKGLQTIIPLFGQTERRLKIVGAGGYEQHLRQLANDYPTIEFTGRVRHEQLPPLYANAMATILPSICYETFGLTVLESLQQMTPVIVSNYGGPREIVAETGGGHVYSNLTELGAILNHFDSNPQIAMDMGQEGHRSLGRYAPEVHLRAYLAIIREEQRKHEPLLRRPAAMVRRPDPMAEDDRERESRAAAP